MRKVGVVGSLVWDEIHGRDPAAPPTEEWGGIAYALSGFDAALPDDWQIVPLIKVGRDLSAEADRFLQRLRHRAPGARFIEVPAANNRVVLRYQSAERRCERMSGGVPPWRWDELGPLVRDLDAVYLNFISGFELALGTAEALRAGFHGPIYADLHSLMLGMGVDGVRALQPLPNAESWFHCFDLVQLNEDEIGQLDQDPMAVATRAIGAGVRALCVTLGSRGVVYFASPGWDGFRSGGVRPTGFAPIRTALVPAEPVEAVDPTGCGDVFGATLFARLLADEPLDPSIRAAAQAAARNATYRGATGLADHLRGSLVSP